MRELWRLRRCAVKWSMAQKRAEPAPAPAAAPERTKPTKPAAVVKPKPAKGAQRACLGLAELSRQLPDKWSIALARAAPAPAAAATRGRAKTTSSAAEVASNASKGA
jgi:hypothetical protein